MLAAAGLPGITSVAWIKRSKLLVGMREGNMLAVIDTAPMEAQDRILQVYLQQEGVAMTDDSGPEPPGPDAEMDFLRRINMIEVESLAELGPGLLTPDSLGALAYDSVHGKVLFTSTSESEAAVYRSDLDGSGDVST